MNNNNYIKFDFEKPGFYRGKTLKIVGDTEECYIEMQKGHDSIQCDNESVHEYFVISGSGIWYYNGDRKEIREGDTVKAEKGSNYALVGNMYLYEKITPPYNADLVKSVPFEESNIKGL